MPGPLRNNPYFDLPHPYMSKSQRRRRNKNSRKSSNRKHFNSNNHSDSEGTPRRLSKYDPDARYKHSKYNPRTMDPSFNPPKAPSADTNKANQPKGSSSSNSASSSSHPLKGIDLKRPLGFSLPRADIYPAPPQPSPPTPAPTPTPSASFPPDFFRQRRDLILPPVPVDLKPKPEPEPEPERKPTKPTDTKIKRPGIEIKNDSKPKREPVDPKNTAEASISEKWLNAFRNPFANIPEKPWPKPPRPPYYVYGRYTDGTSDYKGKDRREAIGLDQQRYYWGSSNPWFGRIVKRITPHEALVSPPPSPKVEYDLKKPGRVEAQEEWQDPRGWMLEWRVDAGGRWVMVAVQSSKAESSWDGRRLSRGSTVWDDEEWNGFEDREDDGDADGDEEMRDFEDLVDWEGNA
jgi:hypothetical protein